MNTFFNYFICRGSVLINQFTRTGSIGIKRISQICSHRIYSISLYNNGISTVGKRLGYKLDFIFFIVAQLGADLQGICICLWRHCLTRLCIIFVFDHFDFRLIFCRTCSFCLISKCVFTCGSTCKSLDLF